MNLLKDSLQGLTSELSPRLNELVYRSDKTLSHDELMTLWSTSWIAQKICKKKASDMTRRWRKVKSNDLTPEELERLDRLERQHKLREIIEQAACWSSLFGGVALLVVTEASPDMPLLKGQTLKKLVLIPPKLVQGEGQAEQDILNDNFSRYTYYRINNSVTVHHSRLIIVNAISKGADSMYRQDLWGYSDLQPVYDSLKRFDFASANIAELVAESKVDVFKMPDLNNSLMVGNEANIAKTMQQIQLIKSVSNSLLIDDTYQYEQKQVVFSGLNELLKEFRNAVAGAADMPVTILFGQSVSGLASGDEDIQNYHETIHRLQELRLRPIFEVIDPLLLTEVTDKPINDFWFEFNSLDEISDEKRIAMFTQFVQGATPLLQSGVLTESQIAQELRDSGLISCISSERIQELDNDAISGLTANTQE